MCLWERKTVQDSPQFSSRVFLLRIELGFCYLIVYLWKKNGTSGGTHKRVDVKATALFL